MSESNPHANPNAVVYDLTGRQYKGDVTIEFLPGQAIVGANGEHLGRENGPHTVPVWLATHPLASKRARIVTPQELAERATPVVEGDQVSGAPAGVQSRDPGITTRESGKRR